MLAGALLSLWRSTLSANSANFHTVVPLSRSSSSHFLSSGLLVTEKCYLFFGKLSLQVTPERAEKGTQVCLVLRKLVQTTIILAFQRACLLT